MTRQESRERPRARRFSPDFLFRSCGSRLHGSRYNGRSRDNLADKPPLVTRLRPETMNRDKDRRSDREAQRPRISGYAHCPPKFADERGPAAPRGEQVREPDLAVPVCRVIQLKKCARRNAFVQVSRYVVFERHCGGRSPSIELATRQDDLTHVSYILEKSF